MSLLLQPPPSQKTLAILNPLLPNVTMNKCCKSALSKGEPLAMAAVRDELLIHITGMKCKSKSYRSPQGKRCISKVFRCNALLTLTQFSRRRS